MEANKSANKSDKKEEKKVVLPRTLADIQRFKLEKLLKNPVSFRLVRRRSSIYFVIVVLGLPLLSPLH